MRSFSTSCFDLLISCCSELWANVDIAYYWENLVRSSEEPQSLFSGYVDLTLKNIYIFIIFLSPPVPTTFLVFVLVLSCSAHWVDTPIPSEPGKKKLSSCIWIQLFSRWTLHALSKTWDCSTPRFYSEFAKKGFKGEWLILERKLCSVLSYRMLIMLKMGLNN